MAWVTPITSWVPSDTVADTDLNRIEGNTVVNRVPPAGFIYGCEMSYTQGGFAWDINFTAGLAVDSGNDYRIEPGAVVKEVINATGLDYAAFVAGTGNGGVASGVAAIADGNWLHAFLVGQSGDDTKYIFGFDDDIAASNLLSDAGVAWDIYRRVGSIQVESVGGGKFGIREFHQNGDLFEFKEADLSSATLFDDAEHDLSVQVPPDVIIQAYLSTSITGTSTQVKLYSGNLSDVNAFLRLPVVTTDTSGRIHYTIDSAYSGVVYVYVFSYIDNRGKV